MTIVAEVGGAMIAAGVIEDAIDGTLTTVMIAVIADVAIANTVETWINLIGRDPGRRERGGRTLTMTGVCPTQRYGLRKGLRREQRMPGHWILTRVFR